jgi:hypothetical protein
MPGTGIVDVSDAEMLMQYVPCVMGTGVATIPDIWLLIHGDVPVN